MLRARTSRVTGTTATGSAVAAARTSRPSKSASSLRTPRPPAAMASTSASTSAGFAAVSSTCIPSFYHRALTGNMRARILGSAAGGGFPQWNCHCPTCEAARSGNGAHPRTQSSIAIRGADGPWFLANASPDLREQLEGLGAEGVNDVRAAPVAGVLLTDAEIDHAAGLLLLRESSTPIRVYGSDQVRRALTDGYPVLRMLGDYSGVEWRTLEPADAVALDGSSLEVESFATGGDAPRYLEGTGADVEATGLVFRDRSTGGVLTYVPGLARWTTTCSAASRRATSCSSTARSGATTSSRGSASPTAPRPRWATCRSPARAGRWRSLARARAPARDPRPHQQHEPGAARGLARA